MPSNHHGNLHLNQVRLHLCSYLCIKMSFFRKLRTKDQGQLLLLLCFALLGLYVTFILAGIPPIIQVDGLCVAFSSLIQYFMLVTFMSMLAESVNLYMKLVVVLGRISYYVIKAYIVVWRKYATKINNKQFAPVICTIFFSF